MSLEKEEGIVIEFEIEDNTIKDYINAIRDLVKHEENGKFKLKILQTCREVDLSLIDKIQERILILFKNAYRPLVFEIESVIKEDNDIWMLVKVDKNVQDFYALFIDTITSQLKQNSIPFTFCNNDRLAIKIGTFNSKEETLQAFDTITHSRLSPSRYIYDDSDTPLAIFKYKFNTKMLAVKDVTVHEEVIATIYFE